MRFQQVKNLEFDNDWMSTISTEAWGILKISGGAKMIFLILDGRHGGCHSPAAGTGPYGPSSVAPRPSPGSCDTPVLFFSPSTLPSLAPSEVST